MAFQNNYFHFMDYILFVLLFIVSMGIGVYFGFSGNKQSTTGEYLMGNRNMKLAPVAMSLVVSVISGNTLLGAPAEIYSYGIMYWFKFLGFVPATIIVAFYFVPLFFPLGITSANEYLEMRFKSKSVRWLGTLIVMLNQSLYVGTVIYGPATALQTTTGFPPWASILFVSVIGTGYTAVGGIKAVVWADFIQSFVMVMGMLAIIIIGIVEVGSPGEVWNINDQWGRIFIDYSLDLTTRFTVWNHLFGYCLYWMGGYGVAQSQVQRFCGMSTVEKGKIAMLVNAPLFAMFQTLACGAGMVAFAYYTKKGCDPMAAGFIDNSNQLIPYFVMEVMNYPGLPGIFVSGLFSGCLSSLSSSIASMAAVIWEDLLKESYSHISEYWKAFISKCLVILFGVLCMGIAFMVLYIGGNLVQLGSSFFGATIGPLLGIFMLGALVPWANWVGALTGTISSQVIVFWMMFGQTFSGLQRQSLPTDISKCDANNMNLTSTRIPTFDSFSTISFDMSTSDFVQNEDEPLSGLELFYNIPFVWYSVIAVLIVLVVGTLVSILTGVNDLSKTSPTLYFSCWKTYCGKKYYNSNSSKTANNNDKLTSPCVNNQQEKKAGFEDLEGKIIVETIRL